MPRRRNHNIYFNIEVNSHLGNETIEYIDNLQQVTDILNNKYFNGFNVITRTMVSNWIHYPDKPRRDYANAFNIIRVKDNGMTPIF